MATEVSIETPHHFNDESVWNCSEATKRRYEWDVPFSSEEVEEIMYISELLCSSLLENSTKFHSKGEVVIDYDVLKHVLFEQIYQLSHLVSKLQEINNIVENGIGFVYISNFPLTNMMEHPNDINGEFRVAVAYLAVGSLMGNLRKQNAKGHILGHVKDLGLSSSEPNVRIYQTRERQTFHTDSCDIVGLLCIQPAIEGGISAIVSSAAIYNRMMEQSEQLALELTKPIPTDKRGDVTEGELPFFNIPVFNFHNHNKFLSVIYQRQYIDSSQRFESAPRLTPLQIEALNLFDTIADDPSMQISFTMNRGDIIFTNNHTTLHDRSEFIDSDDPNEKRHLLRMWIATSTARPLPPIFAERFGSTTIGDRGGINIEGVRSIASLG
eukprot:gene12848-17222_t